MKIGIIGMGYWGPNYLKSLASQHEIAIYDARASQMDAYREDADLFESLESLIEWRPDACIVATPSSTHYDIVQQLLFNKIHVLCEKPVVLRSIQNFHLTNFARENNLVLFPGYTFLFNQAVRYIKRHFFDQAQFGKCLSIRSTRVNRGPVRHDVSAIQDLASHDISIMSYWLGSEPKRTGYDLIRNGSGKAGTGYITLDFNGVKTHSYVSWEEPTKDRLIRITFEHGEVDFNDLDINPIRIYNQKENFASEFKSTIMPLDLMLSEFIDVIRFQDCELGINRLHEISDDVTRMIEGC